MFGNDKKGTQRPALHVDTLIGEKTVIKGDLLFSGGLHVDGTIHGAVVATNGAEAVVMLTAKGVIEGEVRAPHVVINGQLKGDIVASEHVELQADARVQGNIYYKMLQMAAGAQVNGQIVREEEPRKQLPKPVEAKPAEAKTVEAPKPAEAKRA
jgi:cytoskeletal protein CcmA (bactofilin family)